MGIIFIIWVMLLICCGWVNKGSTFSLRGPQSIAALKGKCMAHCRVGSKRVEKNREQGQELSCLNFPVHEAAIVGSDFSMLWTWRCGRMCSFRFSSSQIYTCISMVQYMT